MIVPLQCTNVMKRLLSVRSSVPSFSPSNMDNLRCNRLTCRKALSDKAVVVRRHNYVQSSTDVIFQDDL